jgi:Zn-dependent protease with chaperone function
MTRLSHPTRSRFVICRIVIEPFVDMRRDSTIIASVFTRSENAMLCDKRTVRRIVRAATCALVILSLSPGVAAQCRHWAELLADSFISAANPADLKHFSSIAADDYATTRTATERDAVQVYITRAVATSSALPKLKSQLRRFYTIGSELYGVQLDPENLYVLPDTELNAFSTGKHVFFYDGVILYYTNPQDFLDRAHIRYANSDQSYHFNWHDDWNSLYFVLAHEAAHNLMAHADEQLMERAGRGVLQYQSDSRALRKAMAEGRSSPGAKHYLGQALLAFVSGLDASEDQMRLEEEADAVALEILQHTDLRPDISLDWLRRMSLLDRRSSSGWSSLVTTLFCSTHPDAGRRAKNLKRNLTCLTATGHLCSRHTAFPIHKALERFRVEFATVEKYADETTAIFEGRLQPADDAGHAVELRFDPKESAVLLDGDPVRATTVRLSSGRHVLTATRPNYHAATVAFGVFPDIPATTVKVKLAKCDKDKPCE